MYKSQNKINYYDKVKLPEPTILFGVLLDDKEKDMLDEFCETFNITCIDSFRFVFN